MSGTPEAPITNEDRLRRVGLLCLHFARNMAYYRARIVGDERVARGTQFWLTAEANFIDTAVLEWCKVFGDADGHQSWQKRFKDQTAFEAGLLIAIGMDRATFDAKVKEILYYRDKFIAHLDNKLVMTPPFLDPMWAAIRYCFEYLIRTEMTADQAQRFPVKDIEGYYDACFAEAQAVYRTNSA